MNKLLNAIKEDESIKQYIILHNQINNDKSLKDAISSLKNLQQQLINLNHVGKYKMAQVIEKEYLEKRKALEENPIIRHYLTIQEEIKNLFDEIKEILETGLSIEL